MVANQQKPALRHLLLESLLMKPHLHDGHNGLGIKIQHPAIKGAVLLLGHILVNQNAHDPQEEKGQCAQHQKGTQKSHGKHPEPGKLFKASVCAPQYYRKNR